MNVEKKFKTNRINEFHDDINVTLPYKKFMNAKTIPYLDTRGKIISRSEHSILLVGHRTNQRRNAMNAVKKLKDEIYLNLPYPDKMDAIARHMMEIKGHRYLITTTFAPARIRDIYIEGKLTPRSARSILRSFEHCYGCLMHSKKLLGNNYQRKRHLYPLTYAFADFSYTKGPSVAGVSDRPHGSRVDERDPDANPHVHAIMVVTRRYIAENLEDLMPAGLTEFFKSCCSDVATVDIQKIRNFHPRLEIDPEEEFPKEEGALLYASKALKFESDEVARNDLYTILPDPDFRLPSRTERLMAARSRRRKGASWPEGDKTPCNPARVTPAAAPSSQFPEDRRTGTPAASPPEQALDPVLDRALPL